MTLAQELESYLPPGTRSSFGQLSLTRSPDGMFEACHIDDLSVADTLQEIDSGPALREIAKFDQAGGYRPLKTAPTLKTGWRTRCTSAVEFLKRLDAIYPAVFATWIAYDKGEHPPTSLRKTLDRQTGMYRFAGTITDEMANRMVSELCLPGCLRKIAWPINDEIPLCRLTSQPHSIPVICTEACTFAVSAARSLAKEAYDKANLPAVTDSTG